MAESLPTPLMAQWHRLKQQAPDAWLFFRLGDFYELFEEDARAAAPVLDVQLTSRDGQTPMCGVPFHALEQYLQRAVTAGHSVAVAEQLEDPRQARGLVERGIVRHITPGTFVPEEGDGGGPLMALIRRRDAFGLAALYLAEGRMAIMEYHGRDAARRLAAGLEQLAPAEGLSAEAEDPAPVTPWHVRPDLFPNRDPIPEIERRLGPAILAHAGVGQRPLALAALVAGLRYAEATQGRSLTHLLRIRVLAPEGVFWTSARTTAQLAILRPEGGDLFGRLNQTVTPVGARRLREWTAQPVTDREMLDRRLAAVAHWHRESLARGRLRDMLRPVGDPERRLARLAMGLAQPRDLARLAAAVAAAGPLRAMLATQPGEAQPPASLPELDRLAHQLDRVEPDAGPSWTEGHIIRPGVDAALDRLRAMAQDQRQALLEWEADLRETTGIRGLKVGHHRTFGLFVEVPNSQIHQVPPAWRRRQTMVSAGRFTLDALETFAAAIAAAEADALQREEEMARAVHDAVLAELPALRHLVDAVAWLDAVQGLAEAAERFHWVRPGFVDDRVTARGLRHPLVEHTVDSYVPSDLSLVLPTRIALITGPNMGGKSTFMRAVAQNAWLAQMGSFVAADAWEQPLLHGIYARIGADDDLARGQSTFMVEMEEMAQILDQADGLSLVLLDELGRGTSTFDGLALAWAILEHLAAANPPPFTLFATHYHELVQLVGPVITPLRTDAVVTAGRLLLLHEVVPGSTSESFGVEVAAQAGIPRSILLRAGRLLRQWERDGRPEPLRSEDQAWLFEPDPVVEELRADLKRLRIPEMTPLEALRWLDEWQRRLS